MTTNFKTAIGKNRRRASANRSTANDSQKKGAMASIGKTLEFAPRNQGSTIQEANSPDKGGRRRTITWVPATAKEVREFLGRG